MDETKNDGLLTGIISRLFSKAKQTLASVWASTPCKIRKIYAVNSDNERSNINGSGGGHSGTEEYMHLATGQLTNFSELSDIKV